MASLAEISSWIAAAGCAASGALGSVLSIFGRTGTVVKAAGDYAVADITGMAAAVSITANTAAINTTETIVVKTPALAANRLAAGQIIRVVLDGTCTSTAANLSTFAVRLGTAGTTADALILTGQPGTAAATSGTAVPFRAEILLTVRTAGASATCVGKLTLLNNGITGITSSASPQVIVLTPSTFNTTTASLILSATYTSAAVTTTCTFNQAEIELLNL